MPTDPKWRTVARVSKQPISTVLAVYVHMLVCASNATERGRTHGWNDEDVASALDLETAAVTAIREAMQGRVLEGDYLTGWEKRQPKREDNSADRARAYRERQKAERNRTQANAEERPEKDTDTEKKEDSEGKPSSSSSAADQRQEIAFDFTNEYWLGITPERIAAWEAAYPALTITTELAAAGQWLVANPKNVKSNYLRFLVNWLKRAQDKARPASTTNGGKPHGKHTGFAKQDYRAGTEGFDVV